MIFINIKNIKEIEVGDFIKWEHQSHNICNIYKIEKIISCGKGKFNANISVVSINANHEKAEEFINGKLIKNNFTLSFSSKMLKERPGSHKIYKPKLCKTFKNINKEFLYK